METINRLAEWQGVGVDRIVTSNGSLQLIEFLCLHMLRPGDLVFTESPSYDRTFAPMAFWSVRRSRLPKARRVLAAQPRKRQWNQREPRVRSRMPPRLRPGRTGAWRSRRPRFAALPPSPADDRLQGNGGRSPLRQ